MTDLRANLAGVRERIERACSRARRASDDVALIAVSKSWPARPVVELAACGQLLFGENRVQEAQEKIPQVAATGARVAWHLIGPLQRNKARHAVGLFEMIHGVDSERLLVEIDRRARIAGLVQDLLLQVNVAGESTKAGVVPDALEPLAEAALRLPHVRPCGLMAIPPPAERPDDARRWFDALRGLRDDVASRLDASFAELSMGMSGDFEVAIESGATLVRVGTAIFGEREPP